MWTGAWSCRNEGNRVVLDAQLFVLYDPKSASGPIYSNDVYYGVFDISFAGKPFRSHEHIAKAWQSDQDIALWLAAFFTLGGGYLSWAALGQRNWDH